MEFGVEKCAMLVMDKGKIVKSVGIKLPAGKVTGRWKLQIFRDFRGRSIFRREDEVECFKGIYKDKKSFTVKIEWWEFSSWN